MKKIYLFSFFAFLLSNYTNAQVPALQWQKTLGGTNDDEIAKIQQTSDGGYIVAGETLSNNGDIIGNHGGLDGWVAKLNSAGNLVWQKSLGGTGTDYLQYVQQTSDGGYIVAGYTGSNDGDVSGNHGGGDAWILKLNNAGSIEWQKILGGTGTDVFFSFQQTSDEGYIISGHTSSNDGDVSGNHGLSDTWVVKLSSLGVLEWQRALGGTGSDYGKSIQQTSDGGYIVVSYINSNDGDVIGNHGGYDAWIVKLDNSGTLQWQKSLGGTGDDRAYGVLQSTDGGYVLAAYTASNNGDASGNHGGFDAWIMKLDSSGVLQWQKTLGGNADDSAYSIQKTLDGGYTVVGYTNSNNGDVSGNHGGVDGWVVKLNNAGIMQWQRTLGGNSFDFISSAQQTTDGGYVFSGNTNSNNGDVSGNHGGEDAWVIKLSSDALSAIDIPTTNGRIQIGPNPVKDILYFKTTEKIKSVELFDLSGRKVLSIILPGNEIKIGELKKGIYIVKVISEKGNVIEKIVKD